MIISLKASVPEIVKVLKGIPKYLKMPKNTQTKVLKNQKKGAVAIVFALCLPVIFASVAIVINLARYYLCKQLMQNAIDASASSIATMAPPGTSIANLNNGQYYFVMLTANEIFVYNICAFSAGTTSEYGCYKNNGWVTFYANPVQTDNYDQYGHLHISSTANIPIFFAPFLHTNSTMQVTVRSTVTFVKGDIWF